MNTLFNFFWNLAPNVRLILRNKTSQSRKELLFIYLKVKFKQLLFIDILKQNISYEKIFEFKIHFFDYRTFVFLFEEHFINNEYYFNVKVSCPLVIDCGANIGMALIFFKKLYPNSRIIAFEPDKRTFEKLKKNVEINKLKNIKLFNKAVMNSEGTVNFYYDPSNPGSLSMSIEKKRLPGVCERVDSTLLSNYIEERVDFIKMDIEGAEFSVIQELTNQNKLKLVNEIIIEYHHHIEPEENRFSKILKILEDNGFGYQINAFSKIPFCKKEFQDILIYGYRE